MVLNSFAGAASFFEGGNGFLQKIIAQCWPIGAGRGAHPFRIYFPSRNMIRPSEVTGKQQQTRRAKVLIVDDHPFFSYCLQLALDSEPDFTVCQISTSGKDVAAKLDTCKPDVLIIDVMLRGENGIEVARNLRSNQINTPIIFVSVFGKVAQSAAREIPQSAFVSKVDSPQILLRTLRQLVKRPSAVESGGMGDTEPIRFENVN